MKSSLVRKETTRRGRPHVFDLLCLAVLSGARAIRAADTCATSNYTLCLGQDADPCIWSSSAHSCLSKDAVAKTDQLSVQMRWNEGETVHSGATKRAAVVEWKGDLPGDSVDQDHILPDTQWDVICENGGLKRWAASKGGYDGLNPDKIGHVFGNTECVCPDGLAGLTCKGCANDAACGTGMRCEEYADFHDRELVCNVVHNGAVEGAKDFGDDTVVKLLNDYIEGYDRLHFVADAEGGFFGGMLKPIEFPADRKMLSSPYLFNFSGTNENCKWTEGPCNDWYTKDKTGLKAQGLDSPWSDGATCQTISCDTMDVNCPPKGDAYRWQDTCDSYLKALFAGSITFVCNKDKTQDYNLLSTNFTSTPFQCAMFAYSGTIAFLADCNAAGKCVSGPTPAPPTPTPAPTPSPTVHRYCHKHSGWCYPLAYFSIYGAPILASLVLCFVFLSFNAGFLPKMKAKKPRQTLCGKLCCCGARSSAPRRGGRSERLVRRNRKGTVDALVARLTSRSSRNLTAGSVSRLPANTEDDLKLPFLVDEKDEDKDHDHLRASEDASATNEVWLHVRNVRFAIPESLVKKAAKRMSVESTGSGPRSQILHGVNTVFGPTMTGILGPSGCGKTSLLDIIAGRKTLGTVEGTVYLNGSEITVEERKRCIGYVTQEDVLQPSATAWEVLAFHAALRMPKSTTAEERSLAVDSVLETLRLKHRADTQVGSADHKGLSGGEKRRVSIGIQLLGGCRAILLDEPLSGLDSSSALLVLEALERLVEYRDHLVAMTIHQPSTRLLNKFQRVMLLSPHGHLVYAGPRAKVCDHFASIGLQKLPMGYSPAEYLLDVVTPSSRVSSSNDVADRMESGKNRSSETAESKEGGGNSKVSQGRGSLSRDRLEERERRLKKLYEKSEICKRSMKKMQVLELGRLSVTDSDGLLDGTERASAMTQFFVIAQREVVNNLRVPTLFIANVGISLLVAMFCAVLFHSMKANLDGLISRSGLFFFAVSYFMLSTITSLGLFQEARLLYLHERTSGAYGPTPYFLANFLCDTLINRFIPVLAFVVTMYWPANLRWHPVAMINFGLAVLISCVCSASIMKCIALIFRRLPTAQLVGSMLCMCWMLLAGALLNPGTLGTLKWLLYLSPLKYAFDMMMINEFGRGAVFSIDPNGLDIKVVFTGTQVLDQFYIHDFDFLPQAYRLLGITAVAIVVSYILQRFFLKERR